MDLELRPITEDERRAFNRAVATAFGGHPAREELDEWGDDLAVDRTLAALRR